jgi:hypothetical protein
MIERQGVPGYVYLSLFLFKFSCGFFQAFDLICITPIRILVLKWCLSGSFFQVSFLTEAWDLTENVKKVGAVMTFVPL